MAGSKRKVASIVAVIIVLTAAGTWLGIRWLSGALTGMVEESSHEYDAGALLGPSVTQSICLDTAFARHARSTSRSMGQQISETVFLESCLRASTPSAICDSIPASNNLKGFLRFQTWSIEQCRARRLTDRTCPRLLQAVANECRRRTRQQ